ncbi:MAG: phosphodiester glycosidase family protein [Ruminococcaceae bacterium]|nr:phosphodiester glycosidase family protein [Oscillospiraceae bacterium]
MKKLISIAASLCITLSSLSVNAAYLYTQKISEKVNNAITYEERNIITENGRIKAYIAYVDISNPNASVKVLTSSKGASYLSTVKQMAKDSGAALAINGDFFNLSSGQTNMIGMVYQNGEMVSSPALDNMPSFVITEDNQVMMEYFSFSSTVTSPQGYSCSVYQINKMPVNTGAMNMLTSKWASKTPGVGYRVMLVENGIVTGFKEAEAEAVNMPANGFVLATNPAINGFLDNFAIGDAVNVETVLSPNVDKIKEATGGNTLIVDGGKVANFTSNITGYAQRSSVGISADGKTLILVATDGRLTDCRGLTQTELAQLMIALGANKAINLDGGGSTTFASRENDGSYTVKNNVSSERAVSTAIGVFSGGLVGNGPVRGEITASRTVVVAGDYVSLDAVFYDEYENIYAGGIGSYEMFDENGNPVNPQMYVPTVGSHTIYARCGNVTASINIDAVDSLFTLEADAETMSLSQGSSAYITVYGYDYNGRKMYISPHLLQWNSSSPSVTVNNGTVTSSDGTGAIVTVQYGNSMDFVNINKEVSSLKAPPSVYGTDSLYGITNSGKTVAISGNIPAGATLLNRIYSIQRLSLLGAHTASFVTSKLSGEPLPTGCKEANVYSATPIDGTLFLTLDNTDGYLKNPSDWSGIATAITSQSANIVITAKLPIEQMADYDRCLLKEMMESAAASGKKIFYVHSGEISGVKIENGIRYITCGTVADYKTTNMPDNKKTCPYIVFSVAGNDIRFEFVQD